VSPVAALAPGEAAVAVDPPAPKLRHWYHLYTGGKAWREAAGEHFAHVTTSGLSTFAVCYCSIVGPESQRFEAVNRAVRAGFCVSGVEADEGWEQVTLEQLHANARLLDAAAGNGEPPGLILYAHSKGAADPSKINVAWRRSMIHDVVDRWRQVVVKFADPELDAAGPHWLTPEEFPEMVTSPFFGGNFWWATATYLNSLAPCSMESRHEAEAWIGRADPVVADLRPGWPGFDNFARAI
jgi:hypothetical protein